MKKKFIPSLKDKKDWVSYTENIDDITIKEEDKSQINLKNKIGKLDLHGYSLDQSNIILKKFVIDGFEQDYKKLLIITGKGHRSKSINNPYVSEKLSVLKHSVPEFIENDEELKRIISKVTTAGEKDGGEGAIYIFLKNKNNL